MFSHSIIPLKSIILFTFQIKLYFISPSLILPMIINSDNQNYKVYEGQFTNHKHHQKQQHLATLPKHQQHQNLTHHTQNHQKFVKTFAKRKDTFYQAFQENQLQQSLNTKPNRFTNQQKSPLPHHKLTSSPHHKLISSPHQKLTSSPHHKLTLKKQQFTTLNLNKQQYKTQEKSIQKLTKSCSEQKLHTILNIFLLNKANSDKDEQNISNECMTFLSQLNNKFIKYKQLLLGWKTRKIVCGNELLVDNLIQYFMDCIRKICESQLLFQQKSIQSQFQNVQTILNESSCLLLQNQYLKLQLQTIKETLYGIHDKSYFQCKTLNELALKGVRVEEFIRSSEVYHEYVNYYRPDLIEKIEDSNNQQSFQFQAQKSDQNAKYIMKQIRSQEILMKNVDEAKLKNNIETIKQKSLENCNEIESQNYFIKLTQSYSVSSIGDTHPIRENYNGAYCIDENEISLEIEKKSKSQKSEKSVSQVYHLQNQPSLL